MADMYIRSIVNTLHKYCMSRKKTNNADKISPTPILNKTKQQIGYNKKINFHVKVMLSIIAKTKNTHNVSPKLISVWTFLENRNKYFGTFTFVKILAFPVKEVMPWLVDSLK